MQLHGPGGKRNRRPRVNASRWVVRGSRLFSHVSAALGMRQKLRGDGRIRSKAAPLQAMGDSTSRERLPPFPGRGRRRVRERLQPLPVQPMIDRFELQEKVSINLISRLQFIGLIRLRLQTNLFLADRGSRASAIRIHTSADACQ
jgi:hypothetical protein